MDALRIVDPITQNYTNIGRMPRARWYATPAVLPDGNVLIVGGYQQVGHAPTLVVTIATCQCLLPVCNAMMY